MKKKKLHTLFRSMRIPFLLLTPVTIILGAGIVHYEGNDLDWWHLTLIMIAALAAHISVNLLNEHHDFHSGLDLLTQRTAFSGGSGALPEQPQFSGLVLTAGILALLVSVMIGFYFSIRNFSLLPIGVTGVIIILSYSGWIVRHPFLCLIAPGLAFGPMMVLGTQICLSGSVTRLAIIVSLIPFFLANNLLLLNQFPDINADRKVGRRHIPIAYGTKISTRIFAVFHILSFLIILLAIHNHQLPYSALATLIMIIPAIMAFRGATTYSNTLRGLLPAMRYNLLVTLLTPTILSFNLMTG